jgi:hypothetical protein
MSFHFPERNDKKPFWETAELYIVLICRDALERLKLPKRDEDKSSSGLKLYEIDAGTPWQNLACGIELSLHDTTV